MRLIYRGTIMEKKHNRIEIFENSNFDMRYDAIKIEITVN